MTKLLTIQEMAKFSDHIAAKLMRFAVLREFDDYSVPLTQEVLQDMFNAGVNVHILADRYNLTFQAIKRPLPNGTPGMIVKFENGEEILHLDTIEGPGKEEFLTSFKIKSEEDGIIGHWDYYHEHYSKPHLFSPQFTEEELEEVESLCRQYEITLKGKFLAGIIHCPNCKQKIINR